VLSPVETKTICRLDRVRMLPISSSIVAVTTRVPVS
jgi:hypothetical protein